MPPPGPIRTQPSAGDDKANGRWGMRMQRWALMLALGWLGCGVDVSGPEISESAIVAQHVDAGTPDGGSAQPTSPGYYDANPVLPAPADGGYVTPFLPVTPAQPATPPAQPTYPEYPTQPAPNPLPAPQINLSCAAAVWTYASMGANYADFSVWYSLTTSVDGAVTVTCIVEHKAAPYNDRTVYASRATVTAGPNQPTPACSPESGWVFNRYSNGIAVSYATSTRSGSQLLNCH